MPLSPSAKTDKKTTSQDAYSPSRAHTVDFI